MFNGLCGFLLSSAIFTFFPTLGLKISDGLKRVVEWFRGKAS